MFRNLGSVQNKFIIYFRNFSFRFLFSCLIIIILRLWARKVVCRPWIRKGFGDEGSNLLGRRVGVTLKELKCYTERALVQRNPLQSDIVVCELVKTLITEIGQ